MSLIETNRRALEARGEYVIRANASTGWFAVFPKKLSSCHALSEQHGRNDFHLIVYRTNTGNDRDYWAIPFPEIADQFTESSLTHSEVNGSDRWNCTFRDGILHVTHTGSEVDVSRHYQAPLYLPRNPSTWSIPEELADDETFSEGSRVRIFVNRYERDTEARNRCIAIHGPVCRVCGFDFARVYGEAMLGFIHVHHLIPLHQSEGEYAINPKTDLIPVCPNCHAVIHSQKPPLTVDEVRRMMLAPRPSEQSGGGRR